jgi:hypothetical protein
MFSNKVLVQMAKSDRPMRYISRLDGSMHGYIVRAGIRRGGKPKFFSDKIHGGRESALEAAKTYRDRTVAKLQLDKGATSVAGRVKNRRTKSGVTGVHLTRGRLDEELYWRVKVHRKLDKTFSVNKYGYTKAFQLAVQAKYSALGERPPKLTPPAMQSLLKVSTK